MNVDDQNRMPHALKKLIYFFLVITFAGFIVSVFSFRDLEKFDQTKFDRTILTIKSLAAISIATAVFCLVWVFRFRSKHRLGAMQFIKSEGLFVFIGIQCQILYLAFIVLGQVFFMFNRT